MTHQQDHRGQTPVMSRFRAPGLLFGIAALCASVSGASAATVNHTEVSGEHWNRVPYVADDSAGETLSAAIVHTVDTAVNGVQLQCRPGQMAATVALEPFDFAVLRDGKKDKLPRATKVRLFVNGEMVDRRDWVYMPQLNLAVPSGGRKIPAKIFNAVVRGDDVEVQVAGMKRVTITLPAADAAFKQFAKDCKALSEA